MFEGGSPNLFYTSEGSIFWDQIKLWWEEFVQIVIRRVYFKKTNTLFQTLVTDLKTNSLEEQIIAMIEADNKIGIPKIAQDIG